MSPCIFLASHHRTLCIFLAAHHRSLCFSWPLIAGLPVCFLAAHHRSLCMFPGHSSQISLYVSWPLTAGLPVFSSPLTTGISVFPRLPHTVYFSEEPQVVIWDPIRKLWSLDGFSDHDFREGKNRASFSVLK